MPHSSRGSVYAPPQRHSIRIFRAASLRLVLPRLLRSLHVPSLRVASIRDSQPMTVVTTYDTPPGTGVLVFTVLARAQRRSSRSPGLAKAREPDQSGRHLADYRRHLHAEFLPSIPFGSYDVEVSAVGYLSTHKEVQVVELARPISALRSCCTAILKPSISTSSDAVHVTESAKTNQARSFGSQVGKAQRRAEASRRRL